MMTRPIELIYGGTFDPIHNGHLTASIALAEAVGASTLSFMPCYIPPHKEPARVTSQHRLNMLNLALDHEQTATKVSLQIETFELNQPGPSYTISTLQHFTGTASGASSTKENFGLIIGMDSLLNFTQWYRWQDILALTRVYVMARPGYALKEGTLSAELTPYLEDRIQLVATPERAISSSHIRHQLLTGETVSIDAVPQVVLDYIEQQKLYRTPRL